MGRIFLAVIIAAAAAAGALGARWLFTPPSGAGFRPYNVLYLSADSLNKKRLSLYGNPRKTTPFLEELARGAVVFDSMINPSGWTNENLVSIFSGLYSTVHGVQTRGRSIDPKWKTPIEILRDQGYALPRLAGWQGDQNHAFLGFDEVTVMSPEEWLERHVKEHPDQPFFLFYQFLIPHLPYNSEEDPTFPRTFFSTSLFADGQQEERIRSTIMEHSVIPRGSVAFLPKDAPVIHALYDDELLLQDAAWRRVVENLDALGLREDTILIVGTDHGEELLEHGHVGHASTSRYATLYDEIINVPFLISFPKRLPQGKRITAQVRGIDVMPTLLDLMGLPVPEYLQGVSLLPVIEGEEGDRVAFAASSREGYGAENPDQLTDFVRALRTPEWKFIQWSYREESDRLELFHLTEDSAERHNVIEEYPEVAAGLHDQLLNWLVLSKELRPPAVEEVAALSPYQRWSRKGQKLASIDWARAPSPPVWITPQDGDRISYETYAGKAVFQWSGLEEVPYLIEYEAGDGVYRLKGTLTVVGNRKVFGPFDKHYWNQFLTHYSPVRLRVSAKREPPQWSPWVELAVVKAP